MRPERTIVFLKQFLGDGVMAEPLVSSLAQNYSHVDVLALPPVQQVLGHLDGAVNFVHAEKIKTLRETMVLARKLRRKSYDVAYLVNRSFRSALLSRLAKIPARVGHGTEGRSFLLTRSVAYHAEDFEAKSYADLAIEMGIPVPRLEPTLQVTSPEKCEGQALGQGAEVAMQPGARHAYKQVPVEILEPVAEMLRARGLRIVFLGGPEEAESADELARRLPGHVVNLVGKTSIRQTLGVLANVRAAVGGDTGVLHLAAALDVPTVTCFGPTPAIKWGHHYPPHQVIQAADGDITKLNPEVVAAALLRALG